MVKTHCLCNCAAQYEWALRGKSGFLTFWMGLHYVHWLPGVFGRALHDRATSWNEVSLWAMASSIGFLQCELPTLPQLCSSPKQNCHFLLAIHNCHLMGALMFFALYISVCALSRMCTFTWVTWPAGVWQVIIVPGSVIHVMLIFREGERGGPYVVFLSVLRPLYTSRFSNVLQFACLFGNQLL